MMDTITRQHPDLRHSTDPSELTRQVEHVRRSLNRFMTQDEAWRALAKLNPVFADGHLFVTFPDWRADGTRHLESGGTFFPFEVHVETNGDVLIRSKLGGEASDLEGVRIQTINGTDARHVAAHLLEWVHGDTPAFRAALLSQRWWFFYWKAYGEPRYFNLRLEKRRYATLRVAGSREMPLMLRNENSFERQFRFQLLPGNVGLLTVYSFAWPDKQQFYDLTRDAFSRMRAAATGTLIIDIRLNGGGDDDMWLDGILPYIATKPYRWGSRYSVRIIEAVPHDGETVGAVRTGALDEWVQPQPDNPLRFSGKVYVLVGPGTYSSAILFANVMQDFGFGTVAGAGGYARATQSGGIQRFVLPNSHLVLWWPRFVLVRPSGVSEPELLQPDMPLQEDPYRADSMIDALVRSVKR